MNPLKTRLGLLDDDIKREDKLHRLCKDLGSKILVPIGEEVAWRYSEADLSAASGDAIAREFERYLKRRDVD